jgi:dTDP-glucose 4,6-dehydratase
MLEELGKDNGLIRKIPDPRQGAHDKRYSMDCSKLANLGWSPSISFEAGLRETVQWFAHHQTWWRPIAAKPEYQAFIKRFYGPGLGDAL